jgi:hypothetical protein
LKAKTTIPLLAKALLHMVTIIDEINNVIRLDVILHEVNIGNEVHHCNNFNQLFKHNLEKVVIENIEILGFKVWRI